MTESGLDAERGFSVYLPVVKCLSRVLAVSYVHDDIAANKNLVLNTGLRCGQIGSEIWPATLNDRFV